MRCNSNDCNYGRALLSGDFIGAVVPEDTVGAWSIVLRVGLKYLLAIQTRQRLKFVCVQTRMSRVQSQVTESLAYLSKDRGLCRRLFKICQLLAGSGREFKLHSHIYFPFHGIYLYPGLIHGLFARVLGKRAAVNTLPFSRLA